MRRTRSSSSTGSNKGLARSRRSRDPTINSPFCFLVALRPLTYRDLGGAVSVRVSVNRVDSKQVRGGSFFFKIIPKDASRDDSEVSPSLNGAFVSADFRVNRRARPSQGSC